MYPWGVNNFQQTLATILKPIFPHRNLVVAPNHQPTNFQIEWKKILLRSPNFNFQLKFSVATNEFSSKAVRIIIYFQLGFALLVLEVTKILVLFFLPLELGFLTHMDQTEPIKCWTTWLLYYFIEVIQWHDEDRKASFNCVSFCFGICEFAYQPPPSLCSNPISTP